MSEQKIALFAFLKEFFTDSFISDNSDNSDKSRKNR